MSMTNISFFGLIIDMLIELLIRVILLMFSWILTRSTWFLKYLFFRNNTGFIYCTDCVNYVWLPILRLIFRYFFQLFIFYFATNIIFSKETLSKLFKLSMIIVLKLLVRFIICSIKANHHMLKFLCKLNLVGMVPKIAFIISILRH